MSSSIRLTNSGAPDTPPAGYARIFVQDYNGRLHLKMIRPDGSIQVFGTLDAVVQIVEGGTGISDIPGVGQFLIGTGDGYRVGDIVAGPGVIAYEVLKILLIFLPANLHLLGHTTLARPVAAATPSESARPPEAVGLA